MKALCLALLLAAPARAFRPITLPAPEFPPGAAWINSKPLTLAMLRGRKVVLVVFLDPTALHTLRALPALKAWFDRYALSQLMIVGVITPNLEISKDASWVAGEMKRVGVDFPVVIDGDRRIWRGYSNDGWPAMYLIDRKSRIVYDHLGEGGYAEMEGEMREALGQLVGTLPEAVNPPEPRTKECGHATKDAALGARAPTRPKSLNLDYAHKNSLLVESREGELSTYGQWTLEPDGLRLGQTNANQGAFVRVLYEAVQAFAVLAPPAGKKARFFVKLDEQWLYEGTAGKDIHIDDDGRSFVVADSARLFDLARDLGDKPHELYVIPDSKDAGVYGFQFADSCTATTLP